MAGGESRLTGVAGDGGRAGLRCLAQTIDGIKRAVGGGPVFVPREEGPAVSWLLTEAALTHRAPVCQ